MLEVVQLVLVIIVGLIVIDWIGTLIESVYNKPRLAYEYSN